MSDDIVVRLSSRKGSTEAELLWELAQSKPGVELEVVKMSKNPAMDLGRKLRGRGLKAGTRVFNTQDRAGHPVKRHKVWFCQPTTEQLQAKPEDVKGLPLIEVLPEPDIVTAPTLDEAVKHCEAHGWPVNLAASSSDPSTQRRIDRMIDPKVVRL